ncbi:heparinase II/III domain-containing protein [Alicyclobacillus fodiniaquatilis]|uniref:Heparinase II/III family protein n=1 Tax=Alicyclobacillus fodiniaquatilis TaxID=1661150 RepID=A0ABW4JQR4_9BACL
MLSEHYANEHLGKLLLSQKEYRPFPSIDERQMWEQIPQHVKDYWLQKGLSKLNHAWPTITATQYMDYSRTGNRSRYEQLSWTRRQDLAALIIAECIENEGRFMDDIINGVWCICDELFWGIPGHNYMMRRNDPLPDVADQIIELFSAETAALLVWTYYLLKSRLDAISIMVCERIALEVRKRILEPYLERNDFWWMGFREEEMVNNWNPWCNSNCLLAFLLLEDNAERREAAVVKVMRSLDKFIHQYHSDGGCDEGPQYWTYAGGALFDCLELLYGVSNGKIDIYQTPLIQQIGRYIYKTFIDEAYYANFADGSAIVHIPAELTHRFGRRIGDAKLAGLGTMMLQQQQERATTLQFPSMFRLLPSLFHYSEVENYTGESPHVRDVWLDGIQVMAARERQGTAKGLYVAAKGGHNDESHNHNDVGQFIVYCDGSPMIIDPGVETYTAKTFFSDRYTIWTMQSAYHNLPTVNGVQQMQGRQHRAMDVHYHQEDAFASLSMNIAKAYPDSAEIKHWIRSTTLLRHPQPCIEIKDDFLLQQATDDIVLNLMTPHCPQIDDTGNIVLQDEKEHRVQIQYDADRFTCASEEIALEDENLRNVWGAQIYRIQLKTKTSFDHAAWTLRIRQL